MDGVVTALVTAFTPANFFGQLAAIAPILVAIVPISIGLMFLRRIIKKAARGKAGF